MKRRHIGFQRVGNQTASQLSKRGCLVHGRKAFGFYNTVVPGILSQFQIVTYVYAGCNLWQHSLQETVDRRKIRLLQLLQYGLDHLPLSLRPGYLL